MIKNVIFDMDGVLIDSEPLWRKAMIKSFQTVNMTLTEEICIKTTGLRIDHVVEHLYNEYHLDHNILTPAKMTAKITSEVIHLISSEGKAMDGVYDTLNFFHDKNITLAIATSSSDDIIEAVLNKLDIRRYFACCHSGEHEILGKPHPAVYLSAAKKIKANPLECLAFEDSLNGLIAAKAARMTCIAVPEHKDIHNPKFLLADKIITSLTTFDREMWDKLKQ